MTTMSYANGPAVEPLLGQTIGENLAATVARCADRDALVDVPSGRRWTYAQLAADVEALAKGLLAPWDRQGRPGRHLGTQRAGVGPAAVRDGPGRRDPRQHQSGLPQPRA